MNFNELVGYIGAYIGLFLGYSLLQIPDLIQFVSRKAKQYIRNRTPNVINILPLPTQVHVKEQISNSDDVEIETTCPRFKHTPRSLQSELAQISGDVDGFVLDIRGRIELLKTEIEILDENIFENRT